MNLKQGLSQASFDMRGLVSGVRSIRPDYGWVVIGVVFLGMAVGIGGTHYSFGLFVEPLEQEFGWNRTQLNASLSFAAVSSLVAPLIGRALDKFGARPVMAASILTLALTFGLRPLMGNVWHWYLLSLVHFVAFPGATMLAGPKLVGELVPEDSGADDGGVVDGGKLRGNHIAIFDRRADHGNKLEVGVHGVGGAIGTGRGAGAFVRAGEEGRTGTCCIRVSGSVVGH